MINWKAFIQIILIKIDVEFVSVATAKKMILYFVYVNVLDLLNGYILCV